MEYITAHVDDINKILKKDNVESEIIFLIRKGLTISPNMDFKYYIIQQPITHWGYLRDWFDYSDDFLEYCKFNFDNNTLLKNVMFDSRKEDGRAAIVDSRYRLLVRMINYDFSNLSVDQNLIVYGAGNIGKYFYERIKNKCCIKYFVDFAAAGGGIDNIPIVWLSDIKDVDVEDARFIVTATYDYENIFKTIKNYFANAQIMSLEELLG